jgi:hypothetical protein
MYTREQIEKLVPNSNETLDEFYEKYNDTQWIQCLYLDNEHEDYYVAISNKGDILYTVYYVGLFMPDKASIIYRRFEYDDIEILEDELFLAFNTKDIKSIIKAVDNKLRQKININTIFN